MKIGPQAANKFFMEASYVVALGSNDFINNYLLPVYPASWSYSSTGFIDYLVSTLRDQLRVTRISINRHEFSSIVVGFP